jgi:hypothetical protein
VGASCAPGRRGRGGNRLQTITFSQHGRAFFAIVAFGPDVTAATERTAWATLNSITASALPVTDPAIATEITAAYQNAVMIDNADANSSAIAGGALVDINLVRAAVERLGYAPTPIASPSPTSPCPNRATRASSTPCKWWSGAGAPRPKRFTAGCGLAAYAL